MSEKAAVKREEETVQQLRNLRSAVESLYYSAVWHADRPVDETELWEAVRDAAGFHPGNSPEELPYPGIRLEYPLNRLRLLAEAVRGGEISTEGITAFMLLFGEELRGRLDAAVRDFIKEKLG